MGEGAAEQDKAGKAQGPREAQREGQRRLAQWVRDYRRLPGIPDEFLGADGAPRPVWSRFFDAFGTLAPDEVERRFRHGRPSPPRSRCHLPRARRQRRPAVDAQPSAAPDRRG